MYAVLGKQRFIRTWCSVHVHVAGSRSQSLYAVQNLLLMTNERDAELRGQISASELFQLLDACVAAAGEVLAVSARHRHRSLLA